MAFNYQAAKTAGYTDDEINAYLAKKNIPSALTQPTTAPSPVSGGIGEKIGSFLMGLIKPEKELVTKTAQSLGEQIRTGKYKTQTPMDIISGIGGPLTQLFAPTETGKATRETKFDIASLMVPFGKGAKPITKVLLPGAVAGGLYEAGKETATPTSVLGSAAMGTAGAAILPKIMGAGKTLIGKEKGIMKKIIQPDKGTAATAYAAEEQIVDDLMNLGKKYDIPFRGSAENMRKAASQIYDKIYNKISDALKKSKVKTDIDDAIKVVTGFLSEEADHFLPEDKIHQRWLKSGLSFLTKYTKQNENIVDANILIKWKSKLSSGLDKAFAKLSDIKAGDLTPKEAVWVDLWRSVNTMLAKTAPSINPLMKEQSILHASGVGLKRSANEMFILPAVGRVPGAMGVMQSLASKVGTVMGTTGRAIEAVVPRGAAEAPITSRIGAQAQRVYEAPRAEEKGTDEEFLRSLNLPTLAEYEQMMKPPKKSEMISAEELSMAWLALPKEQATAIQNAYDAQRGSADEQKKSRAKETVQRIIATLENLYFQEELAQGRLGGIGGRISAMAGTKSKLSTYLRARTSVRPILARGLGDVGNLTEDEQKNAAKLLPTEFSTREEAIDYFTYMRIMFDLPPRQ